MYPKMMPDLSQEEIWQLFTPDHRRYHKPPRPTRNARPSNASINALDQANGAQEQLANDPISKQKKECNPMAQHRYRATLLEIKETEQSYLDAMVGIIRPTRTTE